MKFHPFHVPSGKFSKNYTMRAKLTTDEIQYLTSMVDVTKEFALEVVERKVFGPRGTGVKRNKKGEVIKEMVTRSDGKTIKRGVFLDSNFRDRKGGRIEVDDALLAHYEFLRTEYYQNLRRKRLGDVTHTDDKLQEYLRFGDESIQEDPFDRMDPDGPAVPDEDTRIHEPVRKSEYQGEHLFMLVCESYEDELRTEQDMMSFRSWMSRPDAPGKEALREDTIQKFGTLTPDQYYDAGYHVLDEMASTYTSYSQGEMH
jgi:hypothetical protein